jgi:hypothetical protein
MRNRVELLRAIQFTADDIKNIKNLSDIADFNSVDIEFMEEFKKIQELGLNQLEKFINKLDSEGSSLDPYSIKYYVNSLLRSPFAEHVKKLTSGKKYFIKMSDNMGRCGNFEKTSANTSLVKDSIAPSGIRTDTFNKLPPSTRAVITQSASFAENVFRDGISPMLYIDATIGGITPQTRYNIDGTGELQYISHGSLCVKDSDFRNVLSVVTPKISALVEQTLGAEDFRLYKDEKDFNLFDPTTNDASSKNFVVMREIKNAKGSAVVELDLFGNEFDSFERRQSVLKIENPDKIVEYKLHTNQGQLGKQ